MRCGTLLFEIPLLCLDGTESLAGALLMLGHKQSTKYKMRKWKSQIQSAKILWKQYKNSHVYAASDAYIISLCFTSFIHRTDSARASILAILIRLLEEDHTHISPLLQLHTEHLQSHQHSHKNYSKQTDLAGLLKHMPLNHLPTPFINHWWRYVNEQSEHHLCHSSWISGCARWYMCIQVCESQPVINSMCTCVRA